MCKRLKPRSLGSLAAVGGLAAIVVMMVAADPSGASAPLREYSKTYEPQFCVVAPGVLNIEATKMKVRVGWSAPETLESGQSFDLTQVSTALTVPSEVTASFIALGIHELRGRTTEFKMEATNIEPPEFNLAAPEEFETGVPFDQSIREGSGYEVVSPSLSAGEVGRTYSYGPLRVTGREGEVARFSIAQGIIREEEAEAGFRNTTTGNPRYEVEGFNEHGERVIGPLQVGCDTPDPVPMAEIPIGPSCLRLAGPIVDSVNPAEGPSSGGTTVTLTGELLGEVDEVTFGGKPAQITAQSETSLTVTSPPGTGAVAISVIRGPGHRLCPLTGSGGTFTYTPIEKAEYKSWTLSGSLNDKRLGAAITLPEGSAFNGAGEVNVETGAGAVKGNVSIPPFTSSFKLLGLIPGSLGLTLSEAAELTGTVAKSETSPGKETLLLPARLKLGISSIKLLGLSIPTKCATTEPLALDLTETLSDEELLHTGWSFAGSAAVPKIKCEGGLLGSLFGVVLSGLLSGPENSYAIKVTPPGG